MAQRKHLPLQIITPLYTELVLCNRKYIPIISFVVSEGGLVVVGCRVVEGLVVVGYLAVVGAIVVCAMEHGPERWYVVSVERQRLGLWRAVLMRPCVWQS